ncbi:MAG: HNH endonuclease [Candidatus Brocadiae bacterium]|nr:HNH endonuclease [Candidatus Brocadiia bacterium]
MSAVAACALDASVLVLNKLYMPIHIVSARRAFALLCREVAEVLFVEDDRFEAYDFESWCELSALRDSMADDDDDYVQTVRIEVRVPRIVRLLLYDRLPARAVKFNRRNIYARDDSRCQYCGKRFHTSELSLDHVVPRSRGGGSTWSNLVCCCVACNTRKGGRLPVEAHMHLIRKPFKPRRSPLIRLRIRNDKYRTWRHFVDEAYWNVELK